jgi:pilus assembly protein CpaC
MSSPKLKDAVVRVALGALAIVLAATAAVADTREKIRIPVGRSEVVTAGDQVRTVAIAEPKIADAAVGSQRTVVVSGKGPGTTTLVVYEEGGRFTVYDVEVYQPNADKQVLLHVRVAEVTEQAKRDLGFDILGNGIVNGMPLEGGLFTAKVTPIPSVPYTGHNSLPIGPITDGRFEFSNKFGDLHMQEAWRALEEKGAVRVLANPTLLANSGDTASFLAGGEIPIPVSQSSSTTGISIGIVWKEYGIRVWFRPIVQDDGGILLKVTPEVSQLDFDNAIKFQDAIFPALITRRTSTTVRIRPGEHLVIGGLKQTDSLKNVRKVPILGDIPLLGFFLTSTHTEKVSRELLVVVSPEIQDTGSSTLPRLPTDRPEK